MAAKRLDGATAPRALQLEVEALQQAERTSCARGREHVPAQAARLFRVGSSR